LTVGTAVEMTAG